MKHRGVARSTVAVLSAALALGCGGKRERAAEPPAPAWQKIDDGWARTVPLEPPLVLDARAGDLFEAVVVPSAPGTLVIDSPAGAQRLKVDGTARVAALLAGGGPISVRFEGAAATLHSPRISRSGRAKPRRVLLVVVDTLRADAVGAETTPELLDFLTGATRFSHAWSAATWTLPATASLLTGRPPTDLALPDGTLIALAPGETTIASDYAARGFYTVGISANYTVNHENGFSSGCELFYVPSVLGHGDWPDAEWVLDRARRVVEWFPDRDLFFYLHFMDPHDPYRDGATGEALAAPSTGQSVEPGTDRRMRAAYQSEVRRLSALLAGFLVEMGPFERVVVTADHGEEFLEHGGWRHGPTVYPEVARVPLLIGGAGIEATEVDRPVSLVDLRRFLAEETPNVDRAFASAVDVVSFVHAAPRFAAVEDERETILFARDLGVSPAAGDPIGDWLRAHHPALDLVDGQGAPRKTEPGEASQAALRLTQRFHGLAAGQWLWVPRGVGRLRVEIDGAAEGGWWWGAAKRVARANAEAAGGAPAGSGGVSARRAVIEVESPDPFALVFVPATADARVTALDGGALDRVDGPPSSPPAQGAVAWRDAGRPAAALEGVEETMRRLRAQGYL